MDGRALRGSCVPEVIYATCAPRAGAVAHAVDLFRTYCAVTERDQPDQFRAWLAPLRGHDLACWCRLDQPCHADVLLDLANGAAS